MHHSETKATGAEQEFYSNLFQGDEVQTCSKTLTLLTRVSQYTLKNWEKTREKTLFNDYLIISFYHSMQHLSNALHVQRKPHTLNAQAEARLQKALKCRGLRFHWWGLQPSPYSDKGGVYLPTSSHSFIPGRSSVSLYINLMSPDPLLLHLHNIYADMLPKESSPMLLV